MGAISEASSASLPTIGAALDDGIRGNLNQLVTFTKYVRVIIPLDGFVFWVKASLLSEAALTTWGATDAADTVSTYGAFHYAANQGQEEDSTMAVNAIIYTSKSDIEDLNTISKTEIYIGEYDSLRFSFNTTGIFSPNSKLFHYTGNAVLPTMSSQIIDDLTDFDQTSPVTSNSTALWLALNSYTPASYEKFSNPVTLYPSYLVPTNLEPPYGVVHIDPASTVGIAGAPYYDSSLSQSQLVMDRVRVTLYGVRNDDSLNFLSFVHEYTLNNDSFGIMNIPVVRDDKRTQSELSVIAQKKVIDFDVNYYQERVVSVSRQLITSCIPDYIILD